MSVRPINSQKTQDSFVRKTKLLIYVGKSCLIAYCKKRTNHITTLYVCLGGGCIEFVVVPIITINILKSLMCLSHLRFLFCSPLT